MQTLIDDIINTVNELVFRSINAIEEGLLAANPQHIGFKPTNPAEDNEALIERARTEIESGIVKLESLLNATVDKDFDKFEIYVLRNILAVSHAEEGLENWVQLDHYKDLNLLSKQIASTAPEELHKTRQKMREMQKLNVLLKAEEARNAAILSQLHGLLGTSSTSNTEVSDTSISKTTTDTPTAPFAFLMTSPHLSTSASTKALTQNVQQSLSQAAQLRQALQQLKGSLAGVASAKLTDGEAEKKRQRYLDAQARRAAERRGVDVDAGEGAERGLGRPAGKDELEALEGIVQAIGGAQVVKRRGMGDAGGGGAVEDAGDDDAMKE